MPCRDWSARWCMTRAACTSGVPPTRSASNTASGVMTARLGRATCPTQKCIALVLMARLTTHCPVGPRGSRTSRRRGQVPTALRRAVQTPSPCHPSTALVAATRRAEQITRLVLFNFTFSIILVSFCVKRNLVYYEISDSRLGVKSI